MAVITMTRNSYSNILSVGYNENLDHSPNAIC